MLHRFRSFLRALVGRPRFEAGLAEELARHVEAHASDLERDGLSRAEALAAARKALGNAAVIQDDCRRARGLHVVDLASRDARHALRLFGRRPGFAVATVTTLGLCLGANLAVFAVVDAILLRPLPFPQADQLVRVFNTYPKADVADDGASVTNYYERRGQLPALPSLAIYRADTAVIGTAGSTERADVLRISPGFFETLGAAVHGRTFDDAEMTPGRDAVAIVTADAESARGTSAPELGSVLRIDGVPRTVVGILPASFQFLSSHARIFLPLATSADLRTAAARHSGNSIDMVARLAPGMTVTDATAQLAAQNASLAASYPNRALIDQSGFRTVVVPLQADHVASARPALLLLQAGAALVVILGLVNLIDLLLVHAIGRRQELAIRQALGATRPHIVVAVVLETIVIAVGGGVLGLVIAAAGIRGLRALGASALPLGGRIAIDGQVAAVGFGIALVVGVLAGMAVALVALRQTRSPSDSARRTMTGGRETRRSRLGLLVIQYGLAFTLLAGCGLLSLSFAHAESVPAGFRPDHVLVGRLMLPVGSYPPGQGAVQKFADRLVDALRQQPGVIDAGVATNVPLSGQNIKSAITVEGYVRRPGESLRGHFGYGMSAGALRALGLSVTSGEIPANFDATRVCIVDRNFAREYFGAENPIGRRLFQGSTATSAADAFTIVAVVDPMKQVSLTDGAGGGAVFFPFRYRLDRDFYVVTRSVVPSDAFAATLRQTVRSVDPELPVEAAQSMDEQVRSSLSTRRTPMVLAFLFAGLAGVLTVVGIYGVASADLAERRREIAVRLALGAAPGQVLRERLRLASFVVVTGTGVGFAGAWVTGAALRATLFGVSPRDPTVLAATVLLSGAAAFLACLWPALRAAHVSPIEALRDV